MIMHKQINEAKHDGVAANEGEKDECGADAMQARMYDTTRM